MTIFGTTLRTAWLAADGVNKDWSYNFALDSADVVIEVRDAAGHSNVSITSIYLHVAVEEEGMGFLF